MKSKVDSNIVKKEYKPLLGCIYLITNIVNNKVYVGQTKRPLRVRWAQHLQDADCYDYALYKAMRKYGKENFIIKIICQCPVEQLNDKEIYYIKLYNSYINSPHSNGYNMTKGGQNVLDELKKPIYYIDLENFEAVFYSSISEAVRATGVTHSAIARHLQKGSELLLKTNYLFMPKKLFEEIEDIEYYIKTTYNFYAKLTLDGKFVECIHPHCSGSKEYNLNKIKECCDGRFVTYKGYQWCYYKDLDSKLNTIAYRGGKRPQRQVEQYKLDNTYIATYKNAAVAGRYNNIDSSGILKVCKGMRHQAGGYIWKYKTKNEE